MSKSSYKDTILLPKTDFSMRGGLLEKEPKRLAQWQEKKLYQQIQAVQKKRSNQTFLLHDGPPFANGDVHMGTALNKILKDFVIKSKSMAGFATPFVPGWDCHGLPIEFKVCQEAKDEDTVEIRKRCQQFAQQWIDVQRDSFQRLGVFADWQSPYLTFDKEYEAAIIEVFAKLIEQGAIHQSQKPVQWSYGAKTALAEAEVEYQEKKSTALFVAFPIVDADSAIVIWTTTPWTLPANQAVAIHSDIKYIEGIFQYNNETKKLIIAEELIGNFQAKTGFELLETIQTFLGKQCPYSLAQHPFLPRTAKIIEAGFVTTDSGTGAVHIAPGHGADDYVAGCEHELEVLSPVDDDGCFTAECGNQEWVGKHVFSCNDAITDLVASKDLLLGKENYLHNYPYCWRSKKPIIFRAVPQFFIQLKDIRPQALAEIRQAKWLPHWGENRIYSTVEARPDWCISRQRTWGVPLPIFFDGNGEPVINVEIARKVAQLIAAKGSDIWFQKSNQELTQLLGLPSDYTKSTDTLDVWIDSGSSFEAVVRRNTKLAAQQADLYLEATDQHRGWFQSSLILSTASYQKAPYRQVLTHGFVVDKDKKSKLSKSDAKKSGKPIDAAHYYNKYGADIVRLWVSSIDWQNEIPFGEDLFQQITEPYKRLRNSLRILLANTFDFTFSEHAVNKEDMPILDAWLLEKLFILQQQCLEFYQQFEFRKVFQAINYFCTVELSSLYVDITKDRMYCDSADSLRRRATQTVFHHTFQVLSRLLAPILPYTTEEAWEYAGGKESIHLELFYDIPTTWQPSQISQDIDELLALRKHIQTSIEEQVKNKAFQKNNEAAIELTLPFQEFNSLALLQDNEFAKEFFIIAELTLHDGTEIKAVATKTNYAMCPRCRKYLPLNESGLDDRCENALPS